MPQQPLLIQGLLIVEASRSHSDTPHAVGLWTSDHPTQTTLPNNTQHSQQTDVRIPGGIRTRLPSKRYAADPCLRSRGHWDLSTRVYTSINVNLFHCTERRRRLAPLILTRKGKVPPRIGHEGSEEGQRYSCTLSLTSKLDGVGGQHHAPAALSLETEPMHIVKKAGQASEPVGMGSEKSLSHRYSIQGPSSPQRVSLLTILVCHFIVYNRYTSVVNFTLWSFYSRGKRPLPAEQKPVGSPLTV